MNPSVQITASLGACLTIVLIFVNYVRKFNTDDFQRKLLLSLLIAAFIAVITDFINQLLIGNSANGKNIHYILYADISLFLIAQNGTYYLCAVFIDYFFYRNTERSKKIIIFTIIFIAVYAVSIIVNLPLGYYFTISSGNGYVQGRLYLIRYILSYSSFILIIIDVLFASKYFKHSQAHLIILFLFITGIGGSIDIVLNERYLIWPCFAAAILYFYFFIIQYDSKIDSLTGIGNRSSFNEFIDKLSRRTSKVENSIVMIDMDKFKEINDTLGHLEGDNALRDLAVILKGNIRHSDFAARYGGDEFILATEADYDIQRVINRIQAAIDLQNEKRVRPYQIYISYGYDVYTTKSGESIYAFLAKIDALMYKQKEERKRMGIPSTITGKLPDFRDSEEKNV